MTTCVACADEWAAFPRYRRVLRGHTCGRPDVLVTCDVTVIPRSDDRN